MSTFSPPWPVQQFGKWGYVDANGAWVVEPRFSSANAFAEGLAAVRSDQWGYLDATGAMVIAPGFREADDFHEGLAVCRAPCAVWDERKVGVIDRSGAWVVAPRWSRVDRGGAFWQVEDDDRRVGWLDAHGEVVVAPRFEETRCGENGIVAGSEDGRWFLVDLTEGGREIELVDVDEVGWPGRDTFPARRGDRWGWISPDGPWLLPPMWHAVEPFVGDRAPITGDDDRHGLIDRAGRVVIPVEHERVRWAMDGLWWLGDGEVLWLVDDDGARRGGPWLEWSYAAPEGLIFVRGEAGWGALSTDGALVMAPRWEALEDGGDGLVKVRVGERWGVVDPKAGPDAPWILAPEHEHLQRFSGGAIVLEGGKALVDRRGRTVWRRHPPRAPRLAPAVHRAPDWARVVEALPRLRADPGKRVYWARGPQGEHQFAIGPALREDELAALEAEHRVRLPAELRSFLTTVGNGPGVPKPADDRGYETRGGAGPGYGIYDIREALAASPRASLPFVPIRERARVEAAEDTEDDYAPPGLLILGTNGCGWDWAVVVTGPWAGTVWTYAGPGWIPHTPAHGEIAAAHHDDYDAAQDWARAHLEELPIETFADFYLSWLDAVEKA